MTSTATTVLVAVLGVVFGAVSAGGVQAFLGRLDRQRAARAAARVLFADLVLASTLVAYVLNSGTWWKDESIFSLEAVHEPWIQQRASLALAIETKEFHLVSNAFMLLDQFGALREWETKQQQSASLSTDSRAIVERASQYIGIANKVVYAASFTRWERFKGIKPMPELTAEWFEPDSTKSSDSTPERDSRRPPNAFSGAL